MEELNLKTMDIIIKQGQEVLKNNNADLGMISLTVHKNIYYSFSPEEWINYLKKHDYKILIKFVDEDKIYTLQLDGTLKLDMIRQTLL